MGFAHQSFANHAGLFGGQSPSYFVDAYHVGRFAEFLGYSLDHAGWPDHLWLGAAGTGCLTIRLRKAKEGLIDTRNRMMTYSVATGRAGN